MMFVGGAFTASLASFALHSRKYFVAELHMWGTYLGTFPNIRLSLFIEQPPRNLPHLSQDHHKILVDPL